MKKLSIIHYLSMFLIVLSIGMSIVFYMKSDHFDSPIIKFEFAQSSHDINSLFYQKDEFKSNDFYGVQNQNYLDYLFMIIYSFLLVSAFLNIYKIEKKRIFKFGIFLSTFALFFDVLENIKMFKISELLIQENDFSHLIPKLFYFTRIKWLILALSFLLLSLHYFKYQTIGKLFAILSSFPIFLGTLVLFSVIDTFEIFSFSVMIGFLQIMIWSFISYRIDRNISFYK